MEPASWHLHIPWKSNHYCIFYRLVYKFHHFLSKGLSSSKRNHYDLAYLYGPSWDLVGLGVWCVARPAFHAGASGVVCGYLGLLTALVLRRRVKRGQIFSESPKERTKGSPKIALGRWFRTPFEYEWPFFVPFRGCPNVGKYTIPMDPMGRGRKMKNNILTSIFFHLAGFSNCPTLVVIVKCWRRDVPLGTLLMVHSLAHHTNSLHKTDWTVEQCLCDFHYFSFI